MKVLLLVPLLLVAAIPLCSSWMRPRVGGMARFGRSGDALGDWQGEGGDANEDYDEYEEQVDKMLKTMVEKRIPPLLRLKTMMEKRIPPLLRKGKRGGWF